MRETELVGVLDELKAIDHEKEWFEFKEAKSQFDFDKLGRYFSALSNEARLKDKRWGWLIFGISDRTYEVVGTAYRRESASLHSLKHDIAQDTSNGITFEEIHELNLPTGRVVIFQIPPARPGHPTSWKGHFYGRNGESLVPLSPHNYDQIRGQLALPDWSGQINESARIADLDCTAIDFARKQYKTKNPRLSEEVDQWSNEAFLNKSKLCVNGKITNSAVLLLGKAESSHLLRPRVAEITWVLQDSDGNKKDYQHFHPPFLLTVEKVFSTIRNLTYRYLRDTTLFPTEISQYDPWVIRETLHNCIAHQDYARQSRITIVEEPESLVFTNAGDFLVGSVDAAIFSNSIPDVYRNRHLAETMVNLNMIDTIGSGVRRMFVRQRERFFPMPDYDLTDPDRVRVRHSGRILNEEYTRLLVNNTSLRLEEVVALDKVQKGRSLSDDEFRCLKSRRLVEGRRPNLFVSAKIAAATGGKADYIKHRGFDKDHYRNMILSYLDEFGKARRQDLERLLVDKLSDALTDAQKRNRVKNLLQEMRRAGEIRPIRSGNVTYWVASNSEIFPEN